MKNILTKHLNEAGETYWQHMKFALWFGWVLVYSGVACIIHAIIPFLFVTTASNNIHRVIDELKRTGRWQSSKKKCTTGSES